MLKYPINPGKAHAAPGKAQAIPEGLTAKTTCVGTIATIVYTHRLLTSLLPEMFHLHCNQLQELLGYRPP